MKRMSKKKLFKYDYSYKGKLLALKREVRADKRGNKRSYHFFTIKNGFFKKSYVFVGYPSLNLLGYYELGKKVRHVAGYILPEKMSEDHFDFRICIECGERVPKNKNCCPYCGHYRSRAI